MVLKTDSRIELALNKVFSQRRGTITIKELAERASLTLDETRRGLEWFKYKNLIPEGITVDERRVEENKEEPTWDKMMKRYMDLKMLEIVDPDKEKKAKELVDYYLASVRKEFSEFLSPMKINQVVDLMAKRIADEIKIQVPEPTPTPSPPWMVPTTATSEFGFTPPEAISFMEQISSLRDDVKRVTEIQKAHRSNIEDITVGFNQLKAQVAVLTNYYVNHRIEQDQAKGPTTKGKGRISKGHI